MALLDLMPQGEVTLVGMEGGEGSQAYHPDSLMHPDVSSTSKKIYFADACLLTLCSDPVVP